MSATIQELARVRSQIARRLEEFLQRVSRQLGRDAAHPHPDLVALSQEVKKAAKHLKRREATPDTTPIVVPVNLSALGALDGPPEPDGPESPQDWLLRLLDQEELLHKGPGSEAFAQWLREILPSSQCQLLLIPDGTHLAEKRRKRDIQRERLGRRMRSLHLQNWKGTATFCRKEGSTRVEIQSQEWDGLVEKNVTDLFAPLPRVRLRLPLTGSLDNFKNRLREIRELDRALASDRIHLYCFYSMGGMGKSKLINKWLNELRPSFHGAKRVFGYSFHSQGSRKVQPSSQEFLDAAFSFFRLKAAENYKSTQIQVERLMDRIRKKPTLLILDGLEPMQDPDNGTIRDPALRLLLSGLAENMGGGLCVITTRSKILDLEGHRNVRQEDLENLPTEEGAAFLETLGVQGTREERLEIADYVGGHALTLSLYGRYLAMACDGAPKPPIEVDWSRARVDSPDYEGQTAWLVVETYERWWPADSLGMSILRLLGFFERTAEGRLVDVLCKEPAIPGLTEGLGHLRRQRSLWRAEIAKLRKAGLILTPSNGQPSDSLEAHPLIRAYFRRQLQQPGRIEAWKEGNRRLFEHLKQNQREPETARQAQPLFEAIAYGCRAGVYQEAFDLYWGQLACGKQQETLYDIDHRIGSLTRRKIVAPNSFLASLWSFFEDDWRHPSADLCEEGKVVILHEAGHYLFLVGRVGEALEPMRAALHAHSELKKWRWACSDARLLREMLLVTGQLDEALEMAKESERCAREGGMRWDLMCSQCAVAQVLFFRGENDLAMNYFRQAEETEYQRRCAANPSIARESARLIYIWGYWFCELLLNEAEQAIAQGSETGKSLLREIRMRAEAGIERSQQQRLVSRPDEQDVRDPAPDETTFDMAHDLCTLSRVHLLEHQTGEQLNYQVAIDLMDQAVEGLKCVEQQHHLVQGYLARAAMYEYLYKIERHEPFLQRMWNDLQEALKIAERSGMHLFKADCYLGHAAYFRARAGSISGGTSRTKWKTEADRYQAEALRMATAMRYGRLLHSVRE